ncbi:Rubredoxin-oxygen oxidoreductase like protein, partial [Aduncisulcus paluster]
MHPTATAHIPAVPIKPDIYWVGGIDQDIRSFHGYETRDGSSYNAYFIKDECPTLIDTVKPKFAGELLERVKSITPLEEVKYVVSNHAEFDHAGAMPIVMDNLPRDTKIVTTKKCADTLVRNYPELEKCDFKLVKSKGKMSIGKHELSFITTPFVHWPESLMTYTDGVLFSMDAFGQHLASDKRFDDEMGWEKVKEAAIEYYANIVALYRPQTARALKQAATLGPIDTLCCSHGMIIRSHVSDMLALYTSIADGSITKPKVTVVYDTFYHATESMARAVEEGVRSVGCDVERLNASVAGTTS